MSSVGLFGGNKVGYRANMLDDGECRCIKVKVVEKPEIVVHGTVDKPYYEIKYRKLGCRLSNVGYGSYDVANCFKWLEEEFEIVSADDYKHKRSTK